MTDCILILTGWYPSTKDVLNGNFVREQAIILKKAYSKPIVLVLASDGEKDWIKDEELDYVIINHKNIIPGRFGKFFIKLKKKYIISKTKSMVYSYLKKRGYSPKIAIVQSVLDNVFIYENLLKSLKIPCMLIEHYVTFHKVAHYMFKPYNNLKGIKRFVKNIEKRYGVSKTYAEIYSKYFESEFHELFNPISNIFFDFPQEAKKKELFTFINIGGGADTRKRPFFILDALNTAFNHQVELIFVAKTEIETELQFHAKKINFKHRLTFYPRQTPNQLINLLDSSHVLISASEFESFGLTIIEANARGLPVVCSKSGGPNDLVKPNTGYLFEVDDLSGFVEALLNVYQNYNQFKPEEIRNYAIENFSEQIYAKNLLNEINSICKL